MLIVKKIYYSKFVSCSVSYFIKKLYNCVQYSGVLLYTKSNSYSLFLETSYSYMYM